MAKTRQSLAEMYPDAYAWAFEGPDAAAHKITGNRELAAALYERTGYYWHPDSVQRCRRMAGVAVPAVSTIGSNGSALGPARVDGPIYRTAKEIGERGYEYELVAVLPDQQIRGHGEGYDPRLHELVCTWLDWNRPHQVILSGDFMDMHHFSRWRPDPRLTGTVQDTIDAGYQVARGYVDAAGGARFRLVPGNHEKNLHNFLVDKAPQLWGISRADSDERVLTLPYLLRFDELGIEWVGDTGEADSWPHSQIALSKRLAVRHGFVARAESGMSALVTLKRLGHSCIVGHTHRQGIVYRTQHEIDGTIRVHCCVEAGTLAQVRGGLGYAPSPDWQPGFAVARLYPSGEFHVSLATYVNGALLWEGQRYAHGDAGSVKVSN